MSCQMTTQLIEQQATAPQIAHVLELWRACAASGRLPSFRSLDTPRLARIRDHLSLLVRDETGHIARVFSGARLSPLPDPHPVSEAGSGQKSFTQEPAAQEFPSPECPSATAPFVAACERALIEARPVLLTPGAAYPVSAQPWEHLLLPLAGPDGLELVLGCSVKRSASHLSQVDLLHHAPMGFAVLRAVRDEAGAISGLELEQANEAARHVLFPVSSGDADAPVLPHHHEPQMLARYARAIESGEPVRFEILTYIDGQEGWYQLAASPRDDAVIVTMADVTALKSTTFALESERAELMYSTEILEAQASDLASLVGDVEVSRASLAEEIARREELERELTRVASTDALTNLPNRHAFTPAAAQAFATARRYATPLTAIVIDLDYFKKVNDTYGHSGGDAALRVAAKAISSCLRLDVDIPCRFGGEEFVIFLPHTAQGGAMIVAERLREAIAQAIIEDAGNTYQLTASLGVAELAPDDINYEAVLARADAALYEAKRLGRNRCEYAPASGIAAA
jgi:diguanylate cyclase (GGDEF)-like protein